MKTLKKVSLLALLSILIVSFSLDAHSVLYTDSEVESDANIYLVAVKYYDPHAGRFISRDPLGDGLNWYIYAHNNPLAFIDPTGLASRAPNETEMGHLTAAANFTFGQSNADWLMSSLNSIILTDEVLLDDNAVAGVYSTDRTIKIRIENLGTSYFNPASDLNRLATFIHELEHFRQDLAGVPNPKNNLPDKDDKYSHTVEQLIDLSFGHEPMAEAVEQWFTVMYSHKHNLWAGDATNHINYTGQWFGWYGPEGLSTTKQLVYIADYYYYALINTIRAPRKATTWGAIKK